MDPATALPALITALSGPGASFVLLAVVLYSVWKLLNRGMSLFGKHLESIEGKFDKLIDVLEQKVARVEAKVDDVAEDVQVIRRRLKELTSQEGPKQ